MTALILEGLVPRSMIQARQDLSVCYCGGDCTTGNVARVLRNVKGDGADIRKFSAQEHDTGTAVPVSVLLWWGLYNRECGEGLTECEG